MPEYVGRSSEKGGLFPTYSSFTQRGLLEKDLLKTIGNKAVFGTPNLFPTSSGVSDVENVRRLAAAGFLGRRRCYLRRIVAAIFSRCQRDARGGKPEIILGRAVCKS